MLDFYQIVTTNFSGRVIYKRFPYFESLFDKKIISSVVGAVKPNLEIYEHAIRLFEVGPSQVLFVDERGENRAAAIAVGLNGFLL